ncbi:hypothetical protein SELR_pSRC102420 (plasmid) [Selenomonas ruminantium subsp. lactilytica TAM6421]|uniref:Uncharacterized protein n=1 Tax=Selenomonas ruminantium subsp. lactilytica (strain NBRC 103574 / TAM6421) TaxID=927704 RepID=I0GWB2_SELRL|nr:NERD domain-containing protein [Selenomonas ruminantium]BAL85049.1 hypothetical protein SELR_pSRC102420 [Selenomonas ruminantium subsp. lactilytica TAM6421]
MAKFYPDKPGFFNGSEGEEQVYKAFQSLDSRYVVFHSFRWVGDGSRSDMEGEADFVVFHPDYGILVIEVKDGDISYENGCWYSTPRDTHQKKIISPFLQAVSSKHRIIDELNKHMRFVPWTFHAVWFTNFDKSQIHDYPLEAPREIILDTDDLSWPEEAIHKVFAFWYEQFKIRRVRLSAEDIKHCVDILQPTIRIAQTVRTSLEGQEKETVRLTNQQYALLHFLQEQDMAAIHGPAGTGKTILAVEKAKMLANNGEDVLLLCFNEFLWERLRNMELNHHITIHNERTLAEELMPDTTIPLKEVISRFEVFFAEKFDDTAWKYKNVIVDEAQDFPSDVLAHIYQLVQDRGGIFYVFYDREQSIITRKLPDGTLKENASAWIDRSMDCRLVLYQNCRNTAEISKSLSCIGKIKFKGYVNENHGETPMVQFCTQEKDIISAAESFVNQNIGAGISLSDMVILTTHTLKNSILGNAGEITKIPLAHKQEPGKLWFTTVRRFKGLEAKAVLIIDIKTSELLDETSRRLLYVGCSRASAKLKVLILDDVRRRDYPEFLAALGPKMERRKDIADWLGMYLEK